MDPFIRSARGVARALVVLTLASASPEAEAGTTETDTPRVELTMLAEYSSDGGALFGLPLGIALVTDDQLAILDFQTGITLLDLSEGSATTIDRSGAGPGEYERAVAIGTACSDTMVQVIALNPLRIVRFEPDGTTLPDVPLREFVEPTSHVIGGGVAGQYVLLRVQLTSPDYDGTRVRQLRVLNLGDGTARNVHESAIPWNWQRPHIDEATFFGLEHRTALSEAGALAFAPEYGVPEVHLVRPGSTEVQRLSLSDSGELVRDESAMRRASEMTELWASGLPNVTVSVSPRPSAIQGLWFDCNERLWIWSDHDRYRPRGATGLVLGVLTKSGRLARANFEGIEFDGNEDRIAVLGQYIVRIANYETALATLVSDGGTELKAHVGGPVVIQVYALPEAKWMD